MVWFTATSAPSRTLKYKLMLESKGPRTLRVYIYIYFFFFFFLFAWGLTFVAGSFATPALQKNPKPKCEMTISPIKPEVE